MANKLMFEVGVDGSGFSRGLRDMQVLAGQAGARINAAMAGGGHGVSTTGSISESLVLIREGARGNYSRMAGSATLLAQRLGLMNYVIKDTVAASDLLASSLEMEAAKATLAAVAAAEKATATTAVFLADTKATEAQLEAAASAEIEAVAARNTAIALNTKAVAAREVATADAAVNGGAATSITKLGILGIALLVVAGAAYFVWQHFKKVAEEAKNLADLTDLTSHSFTEQAQAEKSASEAHQAEIDRLKQLAQSQKGARDEIDETIKSMRERAQLEKELATARGESKGQLAQMDIAAASAELDFLKKSNAEMTKKVNLDKQAETDAEKRLEEFKGGSGKDSESSLNQANEKSEEAAKLVDALKKAMVGKTITEANGPTISTPYGPVQSLTTRPVNENDTQSVKVGEKEYSTSLKEATVAYEKNSAETKRLAAIQKEIADTLSEKKKLTDSDLERLNKLQSQANELESDLGLKKEFLPKIAAADQSKSKGLPTGDNLVRAGNFLGSAKGQIESLAAEQVRISRNHLEVSKRIEINTRPRAHNAGENHWPIH